MKSLTGREDPRTMQIIILKNYIETYLKWKAVGKDVNGKEITPAITARFEMVCNELRAMGEKYP